MTGLFFVQLKTLYVCKPTIIPILVVYNIPHSILPSSICTFFQFILKKWESFETILQELIGHHDNTTMRQYNYVQNCKKMKISTNRSVSRGNSKTSSFYRFQMHTAWKTRSNIKFG